MMVCSGTSTIPVASNDGNQLQAIQQLPLRSRSRPQLIEYTASGRRESSYWAAVFLRQVRHFVNRHKFRGNSPVAYSSLGWPRIPGREHRAEDLF